MNQIIIGSIVFFFFLQNACENKKVQVDYSGVYCLNIQNLEMIIIQDGDELTFTLQNDLLVNGMGFIESDTLVLYAQTTSSEKFYCRVTFSDDQQIFSGPYSISDDGDYKENKGQKQ